MSQLDIELCHWQKEDAAAIARLANNPKLTATLSDRWTVPYTLEQAVAFVDYLIGNRDNEYSRAICVDGAFAGTINVTPQEGVYCHTGVLGYWLGEPFWGRGLMTRIVAQAIEEALVLFPDLIRLQAEVFSINPASERVLEKNGFVKEGALRNHVLKRGEVLDLWVYGRLLK